MHQVLTLFFPPTITALSYRNYIQKKKQIFPSMGTTSQVTRDVWLLGRAMVGNMYFPQIEDLMFEVSTTLLVSYSSYLGDF